MRRRLKNGDKNFSAIPNKRVSRIYFHITEIYLKFFRYLLKFKLNIDKFNWSLKIYGYLEYQIILNVFYEYYCLQFLRHYVAVKFLKVEWMPKSFSKYYLFLKFVENKCFILRWRNVQLKSVCLSKMANAVTRVVLRCEDAQETNNLGKSFVKKYIYLRKYFTKLIKLWFL